MEKKKTIGSLVKIFRRLLREEGTITLNFGYDQHHIVESKKFQVLKKDSMGISNLVPQLWVQQKVDEIGLLPETGSLNFKRESPVLILFSFLFRTEETKKMTLKLGRKFGIVTSNASLLVLTTLEQYLKHSIKPSKEALPGLYDSYLQKAKDKKIDGEKVMKGEKHLPNVPPFVFFVEITPLMQ